MSGTGDFGLVEVALLVGLALCSAAKLSVSKRLVGRRFTIHGDHGFRLIKLFEHFSEVLTIAVPVRLVALQVRRTEEREKMSQHLAVRNSSFPEN